MSRFGLWSMHEEINLNGVVEIEDGDSLSFCHAMILPFRLVGCFGHCRRGRLRSNFLRYS